MKPQSQLVDAAPIWAMPSVVVAMALAAVVRFHALGAKTFWFDEGVSVGIARLDAYNFLRILWRREANMSLYYLLLHFWLWAGNGEAFIRALSVLFATATIPAIYLLGKQLFEWRVGLTASLLFTGNAYDVYFSQEARSYSLMVFLCICSSIYFLRLLREASSLNRNIYVIFSALAVYAHFYSLLLIVSHWVSLRFLDVSLRKSMTTSAFKRVAIAISPILLFVVTTGAGPLRWIHRPGLKDLWQLAVLLSGSSGAFLPIAYALAAGWTLYPWLAKGFSKRLSWDEWRSVFMAGWLFFPISLVFVLSMARPLFLPRYFLFCLPALLILAAHGLNRLRPAALSVLATLLIFVVSLHATASYYNRDFDSERDDWRSASRYIFDHAQPGDVLLFHVAMGRMPYEYYRSLDLPSLAPQVLYPWHGEQITFLDFVEKPNYDKVSERLSQSGRVWLVISHAETPTGFDYVSSAFIALASTDRSKIYEGDFNGIEVQLYGTRQAQ